jgi:hypothetical protein
MEYEHRRVLEIYLRLMEKHIRDINLRKSGENRLAKMMDSPYHPYSDTRFTITDMEEDALSKRYLGKNVSKATSTI